MHRSADGPLIIKTNWVTKRWSVLGLHVRYVLIQQSQDPGGNSTSLQTPRPAHRVQRRCIAVLTAANPAWLAALRLHDIANLPRSIKAVPVDRVHVLIPLLSCRLSWHLQFQSSEAAQRGALCDSSDQTVGNSIRRSCAGVR